jgi:hypothetical protein
MTIERHIAMRRRFAGRFTGRRVNFRHANAIELSHDRNIRLLYSGPPASAWRFSGYVS